MAPPPPASTAHPPLGKGGHASAHRPGADWQDKIKGKHGIVAFKDYWTCPGEKTPTGDHIDLWNGQSLTSSGFAGMAVSFARFTLGMTSGPGFSDLGKARQITFWEVP